LNLQKVWQDEYTIRRRQ